MKKAWSSFNRAFVLFSPFMVLLAGVMLFQPLWVILLYMVLAEVGYLIISVVLWLLLDVIAKYWR